MNVDLAQENLFFYIKSFAKDRLPEQVQSLADSNLAILKRAAQYFRLYQAFTGAESVQNHETELKWGKRRLRESEISEQIQSHCKRRGTLKIAVSDSRREMVSAFAIGYGCQIGLGTRNGTRKGSVFAEKISSPHAAV
jgi:hypothetical protein